MPFEKKQNEKQLLLVFPARSNSALYTLLLRFISPEPVVLFILAALTPKNYHVKMYNQKIFWSKRDFVSNALVGISCNTANAYESYKLGDRFRKAGATVVMGGVHASYLPEEALEHCDSVVIGEAESAWPQVIRDYEKGALLKIYNGVALEDWFSPSYEYFVSLPPAVLRKIGLLLGRGCKYRCDFCVPFFGNPRFMKLEQVVGLISRIRAASKSSRKKQVLHFCDDNIFADPGYARGLFNALIALNLKWSGSSSLDIAFDEEALALAKKSGCYALCIGFETINPQSFPKTSAGGMRTSEDYIKAIQKIQSYGIKVKGNFILGLDDCTHKYCFELLKFLMRSGINFVEANILTLFPGSRLFERFKAENRIMTYDWRKFNPGLQVVFTPKHMSGRALYIWTVFINIVSFGSSPSRKMRILRGLAVVYLVFCSVFLTFFVFYIFVKWILTFYCLFWIALFQILHFFR